MRSWLALGLGIGFALDCLVYVFAIANSQCRGRRASIMLQSDTRPREIREREGPRPETWAGLPE